MDFKPTAKENPNTMPPTLYRLAIKTISNSLHPDQQIPPEYRRLPDNVLFDIYFHMHLHDKKTALSYEYSDINIFARLIKVHSKDVQFLHSYQYLDYYKDITKTLLLSFHSKCNELKENLKEIENVVSIGLRLGGFLNESGHYVESSEVLKEVESLCKKNPNLPNIELKLFQCYFRLLQARTHYCAFLDSAQIQDLLLNIISKLNSANIYPNLAHVYSEISFLYFMKSEYDLALHWSLRALKEIKLNLPVSIVIDVLRQAAVSCVLKRKFKKAGLLIEHAVNLTKNSYPMCHLKVAEVLMDYGFFLLNSDSTTQSVKVYKMALSIQKQLLLNNNIKVAIAHQDLAYALYVKEYCTGRFSDAEKNAEEAIKIMSRILPSNHLLIGIAKRVTALILEEIAIDLPLSLVSLETDAKNKAAELLNRAEELHQEALITTFCAFGERNVQTAKHYGNLGRVYQSMKNYEKAEAMHLLAISIKSDLLGDDDYEVGLSIGHLASLYNYHMCKFKEAEELHLKSIAISLKLFGESYSGLEYDYRGLMRIYAETNDTNKSAHYSFLLRKWTSLREGIVHNETDDHFNLSNLVSNIPLDELLETCCISEEK